MSGNSDEFKRAAAESAVTLVKDGMVVGLGSGSTAAFAVNALGRRMREGLRIIGIPTSEKTAAQARDLGITLSDLDEHPQIDITIDGADEVEAGTLHLIKGHGGALLREKIVAVATRRLIIVADESKLVERLCSREAVPVEVIPFGWKTTSGRLAALGANPVLRRTPEGEVFQSDGGHYILDCAFGPVAAPASLAGGLDAVVGVVEHGFFIGLTAEVRMAGRDGVRTLTAPTPGKA